MYGREIKRASKGSQVRFFSLLVTGSHLGFQLFEFLLPLGPIEPISVDVRQSGFSGAEPIFKVLHVRV